MVLVIYAHPYPDRSRANRLLLKEVERQSGLEVRSLYDLYPRFDIDVEEEQAALAHAEAVIWQHPIYWYTVPGLLKHWFDKVLARGFAYGVNGRALHGKRCLWVTTTGGDTNAFSASGMHAHAFSTFVPVVEQTARFCGMRWEEPFVVYGAHQISDAALKQAADGYRTRVLALMGAVGAL